MTERTEIRTIDTDKAERWIIIKALTSQLQHAEQGLKRAESEYTTFVWARLIEGTKVTLERFLQLHHQDYLEEKTK